MSFQKTPHINAEKDEISSIVLMPGDPLRAKYIAEKYLTDYKLVNEVRNMFAYTGYYKGKRITIMGSGMGMASMGIYSYELFKFYDVDTIIRIGSCGSNDVNYKIGDTLLAETSTAKTYYDKMMFGDTNNIVHASSLLNKIILTSAKNNSISVKTCDVTTSDVFDQYATNLDSKNISVAEMESYALFKNAFHLNKNAACLLTVVDDLTSSEGVSVEERERSLNDMILVALEATLLL